MTDRFVLLDVRRLFTIALAIVMAFALTAAITGTPAQAKKKAKVTVKVKTKNQLNLLKTKKLNLIVKATAPTTMKVKAFSGGKSNRFGVRIIRFNKAKTKKFPLSLTKTGRKQLSTCGAKTVKVVAKHSKYRQGKKVKKASRKKKLAKWNGNAACAKPPVTPVKSTCDPLDEKVCMQPWPSNFYTKSASTPTNVQLDVPVGAMPKNTDGTPIDPTDINRADGFSPGNLITTKIPEVETPAAFDNSGIVSATTPEKYLDANQAVVVFDAATGERQPIWAELDANPTTKPVQILTPGQPPVDVIGGGPNDDPTNTGDVNLIIRAAKNYTPGHRYIVAIRNLKDASNNAVSPAEPFKKCRDGDEITDPELLFRCNQLDEKVFPDLSKAGVAKDDLYLAWDFTVASQESITGRMIDIRDDAFSRLGDTNLADRKIQGASPTIDVEAFCDKSAPAAPSCGGNNPGGGGFNPANPITSPSPGTKIQRTVVGYIKNVPCYLNQDGCKTGASFDFNADGTVKWNASYTVDVPFRCLIPNSVVDTGAVVPGGTGIYGHGLLGSLNQINSTEDIANTTNSSWCAANFDGFADNDFSTVAASLKDLSNFNKLTDRMQQGFVNFMMIGRALAHEDGFADEPAFQMDHNGATPIAPGSAIDTSAGADTRGYYYGISQGGIMGGALTAVDPDVDRGVLGVPAINYSTLLSRSVDFDEYANGVLGPVYVPGVGLYDNYTNDAELPVIFSIMQLLWDRGEGNGYVQTMNPDNPNLPNTNPHRVLLEVANGDHQVANIAADVEARTLGAKVYTPTLLGGRSWDNQFYGIDSGGTNIPSGNVMVYYDGGPTTYTGPGGRQGSAVAPIENVPPRPQWGYGGDPHGYPRVSADGIQHTTSYFKTGSVATCGSGSYCYSNSWDGVTGLP